MQDELEQGKKEECYQLVPPNQLEKERTLYSSGFYRKMTPNMPKLSLRKQLMTLTVKASAF